MTSLEFNKAFADYRDEINREVSSFAVWFGRRDEAVKRGCALYVLEVAEKIRDEIHKFHLMEEAGIIEPSAEMLKESQKRIIEAIENARTEIERIDTLS